MHVFNPKENNTLNRTSKLGRNWSDYLKVLDAQSKLVLLHCVSKYPCPINEIGINNIGEFEKIWGRNWIVRCSGDVDVAL